MKEIHEIVLAPIPPLHTRLPLSGDFRSLLCEDLLSRVIGDYGVLLGAQFQRWDELGIRGIGIWVRDLCQRADALGFGNELRTGLRAGIQASRRSGE